VPAIASIIAPGGSQGGNGFTQPEYARDYRPRARTARHGQPRIGAVSASTLQQDVAEGAAMKTKTSFDLWSTEQLLLVYERHFGKLDPKARRRIVEDARLNGWDRTWGDGIELLAA
jgi:hypothetical protein